MSQPDLPWVEKLIRHADDPPERLIDGIVALGEEARPALHALVQGWDDDDGEDDDEVEGEEPLHEGDVEPATILAPETGAAQDAVVEGDDDRELDALDDLEDDEDLDDDDDLCDEDEFDDDDPYAGFEDDDEGDWTPVRAMEILARMPPNSESIALALDVLAEPELDALTEAALAALEGWGPAVRDATLAAYRASGDEDARMYLAEVLVGIGVRDAEVFDLLLDAFASDPERYAGFLATFGDGAALPALHAAFESYALSSEVSLFANQAVFELADAVRTLGGTLTPTEQAKFESSLRRRRRVAREIEEATDIDPALPPHALRDVLGRGSFSLTKPDSQPRI